MKNLFAKREVSKRRKNDLGAGHMEFSWPGLGGLARLGEISPFLRNSYKNIMGSYEKRASPPR